MIMPRTLWRKLGALLLVLALLLSVEGVTPRGVLAADDEIAAITLNGVSYDGAEFDDSFTKQISYPKLKELVFDFSAAFTLSAAYPRYKTRLAIQDAPAGNPAFERDVAGGSVSFPDHTFTAANTSYPVTITLIGVAADSTETLLDTATFVLVLGDLDTRAPQLVRQSPSPGAYNVAINTAIEIEFDENLDADSVDDAITLTPGVPFQSSLDPDGKTITIVPNTALAYGTNYTVRVSGVEDIAGNRISDIVWDFTTLANPAAPPVIESRQPNVNATNVPVSTNVIINLNKTINTASLTTTAVTLKQGSTIIPATIIPVNVNGKGRITLDPINDLDHSVTYTVTIAGNTIKDENGNYLAASSWNFTTEAGAVPTIISRNPAPNETDVALDEKITIRFSKPMKESTITATNIYLKKSSSSSKVSASLSYNSSTRTVTLTPSANLEPDTVYYVYVTASVKDTINNPVSSTNWKFTTAETGTTRVISMEPDPGEDDVPIDTEITIRFSEPLYSSSATNKDNIYLRRSGTSGNIDAKLSYQSSTRTVTLTPDETLLPGTKYTVYVTNKVKNANMVAVEPYSWSFTTADASNVYITRREPDSGDSGFPLDGQIQITFSGALDSSTVNTSNIYLRESGSSLNVLASVSYSLSGYTVTLTPLKALEPDTEYTVHVTSNVKDKYGDPVTPSTWKFTTSGTIATIAFRDPAINATNVSVGKTITIRFSKAMTGSTIIGSNIYLRKDGSNTNVPAAISFFPYTYTVTIDPLADLEPNTKYTVFVTNGVKDANGTRISATSWSFTTEKTPSQIGAPGRPVVKLNGNYMTFTDVHPYIKNNRTMIPYRVLFEALGAKISYNFDNPNRKWVSAVLNGQTVTLYIGSRVIYKGQQPITIDVAPEIVNDRTMIPLRFASEALGAQIDWDPETYTVIITT